MNKHPLYYFFIALLAYLPSCAGVPLGVYLFFVPIVIFHFDLYKRNALVNILAKFKTRLNFQLVGGILFLAFINRVIEFSESPNLKSLYSYIYLLPLLIGTAYVISHKKVFNWLLVFIGFEVLLSVVLFSMGYNSPFPNLDLFKAYTSFDYELLYRTRVLGLSANSSAFSIKILFAIIILDALRSKLSIYIPVKILLLSGMVLTFSRIGIVILGGYYVTTTVSAFVRKEYKTPKYFIAAQAIWLSFVGFWLVDMDWTATQFNRKADLISKESRMATKISKETQEQFQINDGQKKKAEATFEKIGLGKVEMSGRKEIWQSFLGFISDHFWWGNRSEKLLIGPYHAHNSFIQLLASNGIFIFGLFMILILRNVHWISIESIIIIGMLSMGQYTIFWGMSLFDILFYSFLLQPQVLFARHAKKKTMASDIA